MFSNSNSEMDERVDDMQQLIATENAEKKSNEKEKSLEETDSKGQTRGKSKNKKNKNKKRKYQGEHADFCVWFLNCDLLVFAAL